MALKPPRWHLCRGGICAAVAFVPRQLMGGRGGGLHPRGGSQGFPVCQRVRSAPSITAGSLVPPVGGTDGQTDAVAGRTALGIGAACVNPAGAGARAGLGSSLVLEE